MKSWVKAWLGAGVGCLVCGVVLTGIGVASGGNKYVKAADLNKMDGAAKKEDNEALLSKTKIDNFDSVDISMTDMNLQVICSDDQSCYISYQASNQKTEPISGNNSSGLLMYLIGRRKYPIVNMSESNSKELEKRKKSSGVGLLFLAIGVIGIICATLI
jgi:hypothetical protein